jgi:hypothetical protein
MRASILKAIKGSDIDRAVPKRYFGMADLVVRRSGRLDVIVFSDAHVVTSADLARALKRVGTVDGLLVVFMGDATAEVLAAVVDAGGRHFTLRAHGWTDARYAAIRQPTPHARDRERGGFSK